MKIFLCMTLSVILLSSAAFAVDADVTLETNVGKPATAEAVPGCDWVATVDKIGRHDGAPALALKLGQMKGSCMHDAGACGLPKDIVYAPILESEVEDHDIGQKLDVWVVGTKASTVIPPCAEDLVDNQ